MKINKNNKGFTLVELIATIVVLAMVMGIASYSIVGIINSSKEKDYQLLIENINNAVEEYYMECRYVNDNNCVNEITLGYLVTNGFLKGNSTDSSDKFTLANPNTGVDISKCKIKYTYNNGKISVQSVVDNTLTEEVRESCPNSY